MQIGQVPILIVVLLQGIVILLEKILPLGRVKDKMLLEGLVQKQNIGLWLQPHANTFESNKSFKNRSLRHLASEIIL